MFIPRTLQTALHRLIRSYPVLAITGPRQSGKTTLLRKQFPKYRYVSLENPDIRERAEEDPNSFLKKYDRHVILDEVQRTPHPNQRPQPVQTIPETMRRTCRTSAQSKRIGQRLRHIASHGKSLVIRT